MDILISVKKEKNLGKCDIGQKCQNVCEVVVRFPREFISVVGLHLIMESGNNSEEAAGRDLPCSLGGIVHEGRESPPEGDRNRCKVA